MHPLCCVQYVLYRVFRYACYLILSVSAMFCVSHRWASPFSPFANGKFRLFLRLHDEQMVKGVRKIASASVFGFSFDVSILHVSMSLCLHVLRVSHVSMFPCFHISMSPCLHVFMSPCFDSHISMFS
jgi:hypothetical protein